MKPENLILEETSGLQNGTLDDIHLRIIDFGSAVDPLSTAKLYGQGGPSELEHTQEYAPPEALLSRSALPQEILKACTWMQKISAFSPPIYQGPGNLTGNIMASLHFADL